MARRLHCYVVRHSENTVTDNEWDEIRRLQHWYSSEFIWTAGRPALKMFAVFPNFDHPLADENRLNEYIAGRWGELKRRHLPENAILKMLQDEKLVLLKEGGYRDGCILSGSVRVADNEWNAYLFTELILKASRIAKNATFEVHDEGEFINWRPVYFRDGSVYLRVKTNSQYKRAEEVVGRNELFARIDAREYDDHPTYRSQVSGFRRMERSEKHDVLMNWNWHGYNSIINAPENRGFIYDLNEKVKEIDIREIA
jgi:hypothetical protein